MTTALELLRQGRRDDIWKKYCGFIDLSLEEFMEIQKHLLMEQIDLLSRRELGRKLLGDKVPTNVQQFRARVPLTTYADYAPYLMEKKEDILPCKPRWWLRTSGRSGEYGGFKWVPYSPRMAKKLGETVLALFILASCTRRGEFLFEEGDRMFYSMAPFAYMSGGVARAVQEESPINFLPPLEEAEAMEYQERIQKGLKLALREGVDHINAIAVVLARIGEQFTNGSGGLTLAPFLLHPRVLARLARVLIKARMAGRKHLLPKDLWNAKGIATGGTDTSIFRERIKKMWGQEPIEAYGCTEAGVFSLQLWNCNGMTFLPDLDFLEFIPMHDYLKNKADPGYHPPTVLLDEVKAGEIYEVVVTNFSGGIITRYRVGDLVRITSLDDEELRIHLPQMVYHSKSSDTIDLASFTRLTERTLWQAIEEAGIAYVDWTARKEHPDRKPVLCLYREPKAQVADAAGIKKQIHQNLKALDSPYANLEQMMGIDPLRVILLPPGAFKRYYETKQREGADSAHLKPAHMNASDADLALLLDAHE